MVGQFEGHRFHPRFVRICGAARKGDAAGFKLHDKKKIESIEPMDYFSFLHLIKNSKLIVSDSGGVQEEACILRVPLITIRNSTERPETLEIGCNILSKIKDKMVYKNAMKILNRKIKWKNPYGNGDAALKSYSVIKDFLKKNDAKYY